MEKEAVERGESDKVLLDEEASPTAGRRFTRACSGRLYRGHPCGQGPRG